MFQSEAQHCVHVICKPVFTETRYKKLQEGLTFASEEIKTQVMYFTIKNKYYTYYEIIIFTFTFIL